MAKACLREQLLQCSSCESSCELHNEGVFCQKCNHIVINLPDTVVELLRSEEIWAEKWDTLHTALEIFLQDARKGLGCRA